MYFKVVALQNKYISRITPRSPDLSPPVCFNATCCHVVVASVSQVKCLTRHNKTHSSLLECIHFACGTVVESIHDGVCRIKAILANRSHVSFLGRDVGDSGLLLSSDWLYVD